MLLIQELLAHISIGLEADLMPEKHHFLLKSMLAACFLPWLACTARPTSAAEPAHASMPNGVVRWTCNAFYLPARSIWQRTVDVEFDSGGVRSVQIDGVAVYAFNIQGTTILTSVDSERVQFDATAQTWTSDLRGIVSSQGRCQR
jgi:hypothetical protein